jgi:hypothetical protein
MRPVVEAQIGVEIALRLRYRSAQGGNDPDILCLWRLNEEDCIYFDLSDDALVRLWDV